MVQINVEKELAALIAPTQDRFTGMRYGQGTILTWNPETFENTVDFRGITLTNVAILSGPDALTYQPGDVVGLMGWAPGGGFGSWWILGRVITPGEGAGESAIDFMATSLGAAVAQGVIGASIFYDFIDPVEQRDAFGSFGDLSTVGPSISFELPGTEFVCVWGAQARAFLLGAVQQATGNMGIDVSGPDSFAPSLNFSAELTSSDPADNSASNIANVATSRRFTGVTPGSYTVTAKYHIAQFAGSTLPNASWGDRWLLVIGF